MLAFAINHPRKKNNTFNSNKCFETRKTIVDSQTSITQLEIFLIDHHTTCISSIYI